MSQFVQKKLHIHGKSKFSLKEDAQLVDLIRIYGDKDWAKIAQMMPGRNTRQCRERWRHYLSPDVTNRPFSELEDALLHQKYRELGNQWKLMATFFPGRTDIAVKNRWLLLHRRRMRKQQEEANTAKEESFAVREESNKDKAQPGKKESLIEIEWNEEQNGVDDDETGFGGYSTDLSTDYFCLGFTY